MIGACCYQKANMLWHSDSSFKQVLSRCSILSAREIPAVGGATEFASTRAAYESLDADRQRELEGLIVEHNIVYSRRLVGFEFTPEEARSFHGYRHKLVQDCAITGRKSVLIGAHAKAVVGWPEDKSRALLDDLLARANSARSRIPSRMAQWRRRHLGQSRHRASRDALRRGQVPPLDATHDHLYGRPAGVTDKLRPAQPIDRTQRATFAAALARQLGEPPTRSFNGRRRGPG